jgi:hypothetical protein
MNEPASPTTPETPAEIQSLFQVYDRMQAGLRACRAAALAKTKPVLFDALKRAGIVRVVVSFDGEGDSGQIESVTAYRDDDTEIDLPDETITCAFADMEAIYVPCDVNPSGQQFAGYQIEDKKKTAKIAEIIDDIFWDFIGAQHGGWENNDGGFGECHFLVEDEIIRLEMNERYTETNYSEHEW